MTYTIEKKELSGSNILFMRRRVQHSEIVATLGELLGGTFGYATKSGAALAGPPLCRYRDVSSEGMTLEAGVPVATSVPGEGDVLAGSLPAGPVASTVHRGPYETLSEAYAALEKWIAESDSGAGRRSLGGLSDRSGRGAQSGRLANGGQLAGQRVAPSPS